MNKLIFSAWVAFMLCVTVLNLWLLARLLAPEVQAASDRICVPLYDETGLECCK